MKKISYIIAVIAVFALASCGGGTDDKGNSNDADAKMVEVNLAEKGIPTTFMAPEGFEIVDGLINGEIDGISYYNYEVKKGDFIMDVQMEDADLQDDMATLLEYAKEIDTSNPDFVEFVKEEENGYIAKMKSVDGTTYSFYYALIKDNRAIEFSEGLNFNDFTMEQIETLYNAAKAAK